MDCCFLLCFESQNLKVRFNPAICRSLRIVWHELIWVHNEKNIGKHCKQIKSKKCFKLNSLQTIIEMLGQNWQ